jgi:CRISPR system Cascade subunit CasA
MTSKFNLIDEAWIPVEGRERASLCDVFKDRNLESLGGNATQKVSLLKLLLAIAHVASPVRDEEEWRSLGDDGLGERCLEYLREKKDCFWLYGDRPFLQMPVLGQLVGGKEKQPLVPSPIGKNYLPDLPAENDTIIFQSQVNRQLTDAEKAIFIISIMNYGLGGKRTVKELSFSDGSWRRETKSAKPGPSVGGYQGYLNSCLWGTSIRETVWLNLLTRENLDRFERWKRKELIAPWERMPDIRDEDFFMEYREGFMATLCGLSRFVLLKDDGVIYAEGIPYPSHKEGWKEPFLSQTVDGKPRWLDGTKRPWRELQSLLSASFNGNDPYTCPQISLLLGRTRLVRDTFGIWSGGLQIRGNAGDYSVKQTDDFIESLVMLHADDLGSEWFNALCIEMRWLDELSFRIYQSVKRYFMDLGDKQSPIVPKAQEMFWTLCEGLFQHLVDSLLRKHDLLVCRRLFTMYARQSYDFYCSNEGSRQMTAWAKNRPKLWDYLDEMKEEKIG